MRIFLLFTGIFLVLLGGCQSGKSPEEVRQALSHPSLLHATVQKLTDIMVHNTFSPPAASRVYSYPSIVAYEIMQQADPNALSFYGRLNDMPKIPEPENPDQISFPIAAVYAYSEVGKKLIFTEEDMEAQQAQLLKAWKIAGASNELIEQSIEHGKLAAKIILDWANTDGYKETRTGPRYSFQPDPSTWQPTPPAYMDGIEPNWREIRPFVLDSANQFAPPPPTDFSTSESSPFYKEVLEVYNAVNQATEEHLAIAGFWDCNPYVMNQTGHVMYAVKKISPGGHWIGIAGIVSRKAGADMLQTTRAYALTSIALADGFISCWDEKYRSNLVRPETYINEYLDESWKPTLQTPPFPEYTSGHSVISTAAAEALTSIFGPSFEFRDSSEMDFGLPVRTFKSFKEASSEAAISRLYGGIHYRPAIENGVKQGEKVGKLVVERLKTQRG